ncbi:MAG: hypothetical protein Kow00121_45660 [Elainellaceae cyanobacterium]
MGATSLLLPRQDDGAAAAEPKVPDTTIAASHSGSQSAPQSSEVQLAVAPLAGQVEHVVRRGQTLQQLADRYQVNVSDIAAANGLEANSALRVGQVLKIPVAGVQSASRPSPLVASADLNYLPNEDDDQIESSLTVERDNALDRLRQQRDKLRESLAELRYEESNQSAVVAPKPEIVAANPVEADASISDVSSDASEAASASPQPAEPVIAQPGFATAPQTLDPNWLQANQSLSLLPSSESESVAPSLPIVNTTSNSPSPTVSTATLPTVAQPSSGVLEPFTYRVAPGDTVAAIARSHNIPQSLLIETNRLSDPNVIFVGQVLTVPSTPSSPMGQTEVSIASASDVPIPTVLPSVVPSSTVPNSTVPNSTVPSSTVPSSTVPSSTQPSLQVPTVPTVPSASELSAQPYAQALEGANEPVQAVSQAEDSASELQEIAVAPLSEPLNGTEISIPTEIKTDTPAVNDSLGANPYVSNLLSEIRALRQRNQPVSDATTSAVASSEPSVEPSTTMAVAPIAAEISTDRGEFAVSPQMVRAAARSQEATNVSVQDSAPAGSSDSSDLVATRSLGSENYAPLLQPITGRMVSPELPPLPGADSFLPEDGLFAGYIWPSRGVLSSGYGWRWGRMHQGIDIAADVGTPIYAAATGVIEFAGWNSGGYGNMVEIRHSDGSMTRYAHMNAIHVSAGQNVTQGEQIGEMGSTGYSTGPHLHFEVHLPNQGTVNPMAYLPAN